MNMFILLHSYTNAVNEHLAGDTAAAAFAGKQTKTGRMPSTLHASIGPTLVRGANMIMAHPSFPSVYTPQKHASMPQVHMLAM